MEDADQSVFPAKVAATNIIEEPETVVSETGVARREFLQRSTLTSIGMGTALLGGAGCHDVRNRVMQFTTPAPPQWSPLPHDADKITQAVHVLNRIAYGPRPGDVARVVQMGTLAYVEEQLGDGVPPAALATEKIQKEYSKENAQNRDGDYEKQSNEADYSGYSGGQDKQTSNASPKHKFFNSDFDPKSALKPFPRAPEVDTIGEDAGLEWRVNSLDAHQVEQDMPDMLYSLDDSEVLTQTAQAALLRALYSRHQLREVMADFWTNHFNIYALKNDGRSLVPTDTERVLRPHALGSFAELLTASAHSPAMLAYLDNNQNRRRSGSENANENYARELLELHTLGVKSGYTQRDIQEVARCFTGWTVTTGWNPGKFGFDRNRHDEGAKFIPYLNLTITPKGGEQDASMVLERLAMHPTTAHFIARKLCRRFLGDAPDAVVEKSAAAYLNHNTDIRAALRPILLDALTDSASNKPILKRPLDYVATSLRAIAADSDCGGNLQKHLAAMGQPLYLWPMPDGFPEKASSWSGSMLPRWNYALALTSNTIKGTDVDLQVPLTNLMTAKSASDAAILDTMMETVYNRPHNAVELAAVRKQVASHIERARQSGLTEKAVLVETAALLFAAPPFQWK